MKTRTRDKLQAILAKHKLWLEGAEGGERANLTGACLEIVYLREADLRYAILSGVNFRRADLKGSDFGFTDLKGAYFDGADLRETRLDGANLRGTGFIRADLAGSSFKGATLDGAGLCYIKNKLIITFQAGKHFAYYCDGLVKIGCEMRSLEQWLDNYKQIGEAAGYSKEDIHRYGVWLHSLKEML